MLSPLAQRKHGFTVGSLPSSPRADFEGLYGTPHGQLRQDAWEERLAENTRTPVVDQVCFRLDWPEFLRTLTPRDRALAGFLSLGHRASTAAKRFGLTPGRVTQLRRSWCEEWRRWSGETG